MARRNNFLVTLLAVVGVATLAFIGYTYGSQKFNENDGKQEETEEIEETVKSITIYGASIEYAQESATIDLTRGVIKTSAPLDKIIINISFQYIF